MSPDTTLGRRHLLYATASGAAAVTGTGCLDRFQTQPQQDENQNGEQNTELVMDAPVEETVEVPAHSGYQGFHHYTLDATATYLEYTVSVDGREPLIDVLVMTRAAFTSFADYEEFDYLNALSQSHTYQTEKAGQLPETDAEFALVLDNSRRGPTSPDHDIGAAEIRVTYRTGRHEPVDGQ